jgi:copper chaperone CopZ
MTYKIALLFLLLLPNLIFGQTSKNAIKTTITLLNQGKKTVEISTSGMNCLSCVGQIKSTLHKLEGVENVDVDLANRKVIVTYLEKKVNPENLSEKINELGYKASRPVVKE